MSFTCEICGKPITEDPVRSYINQDRSNTTHFHKKCDLPQAVVVVSVDGAPYGVFMSREAARKALEGVEGEISFFYDSLYDS